MQDADSQLVRARLDKLHSLRTQGIEPYPHRFDRTHTSAQAVSHFETSEVDQGDDARTDDVTVAGRIVRLRGMGKAIFLDLLDGHGRIQVLLRRNLLPDSFEALKDLDIGDWLGAAGPLFRTRTKEITVEAHDWTLLSKSLRPLPEKWHGLADVEARYRQRYLDLIANEGARSAALTRSRLVSALRNYMGEHGFMEVETPVLVPIAAGGTAKPFSTHYESLDRDLYLRIATELYLKRLIVGGFEKVYEIGRTFRNEGVDYYHNPEFTMMESYEAFADYNDVMRMVEEMVAALAKTVLGSHHVEFDGNAIDLTPPWQRLDLREEVKRRTGIDFVESSELESLRTEMIAAGMEVGEQASWGGLMDKLLSSAVEPHLVQPAFLVDYPVEMSPLAKKKRDDSTVVERFEGFVGGMEICNAFTELNDPIEQRGRLEQQEALHAQFEDEDMDRLDEDFLVAMEHGMPPTGGLGVGIDRLAMLFSGHRNIREVVLFPQLRSR